MRVFIAMTSKNVPCAISQSKEDTIAKLNQLTEKEVTFKDEKGEEQQGFVTKDMYESGTYQIVEATLSPAKGKRKRNIIETTTVSSEEYILTSNL